MVFETILHSSHSNWVCDKGHEIFRWCEEARVGDLLSPEGGVTVFYNTCSKNKREKKKCGQYKNIFQTSASEQVHITLNLPDCVHIGIQ